MKEIIIGIVCLCSGIVCGYFIWNEGDTSQPCTIQVCCQILEQNPGACDTASQDTPSITLIEDVDTLIGLYRNYKANNDDSLGYSLDREIIRYLHTQIQNNPTLAGYRLYPGYDGVHNKTIFIGLERISTNTFLSESANFAKGFQFVSGGLMGYTGPCPDWCDNNTRLITTGNQR